MDAPTTKRSRGHPGRRPLQRAEDIKTAEQAAIYGGTADDAYYHQACDDLSNLNKTSILVSEILRTKVGDCYYPGQATLTELAEYGAGTVGNSQRLLAEILRSKRIRRDRPTAGCAVGARC